MNVRPRVAPLSWFMPVLLVTACGAHVGRVPAEQPAEVTVVWRACRADTGKDSDHGWSQVNAFIEGAPDGHGPVAIGRLPPCAIRQGIEGLWCNDPFEDGHFELIVRRPAPGTLEIWLKEQPGRGPARTGPLPPPKSELKGRVRLPAQAQLRQRTDLDCRQ
jgi:hypothetical protein